MPRVPWPCILRYTAYYPATPASISRRSPFTDGLAGITEEVTKHFQADCSSKLDKTPQKLMELQLKSPFFTSMQDIEEIEKIENFARTQRSTLYTRFLLIVPKQI